MQLWNWRGLDVINAHERDPAIYLDGMQAAVDAVESGLARPAPALHAPFALEQLGDALNDEHDAPGRLHEGAGVDVMNRRRVLMTADTVGGVWTYALELTARPAGRSISRSRPWARRSSRAAREVAELRRTSRFSHSSYRARMDGRSVGGRRCARAIGCCGLARNFSPISST